MYAEYTVQKLSPSGTTTAPQRQNWILYYVQLVQKGNKPDLSINNNVSINNVEQISSFSAR